MSPGTVTGRFCFPSPAGSGLRRPGGVRELRLMTLTSGLTYSKSVTGVVTSLRLSTAAVRASGESNSTFRGLRIVGAAVDSRPPLEKRIDVIPRCRKSLRCVLHVFRESGEFQSLWRMELRTHQCACPSARTYSVLPVAYVVL
ncbi:hypothetical protein EVAR_79157_1 [Eumeta japonica]|uniref:Uncharacterized protein n=1 Tax=Eumeta variegata TaxID=151549 RepID=A0A4C1UT47_EUMVA|nr:hypothetical protein EVAR_79157_1 [Eumeta japonica]